jgi:hypothetical protein
VRGLLYAVLSSYPQTLLCRIEFNAVLGDGILQREETNKKYQLSHDL